MGKEELVPIKPVARIQLVLVRIKKPKHATKEFADQEASKK